MALLSEGREEIRKAGKTALYKWSVKFYRTWLFKVVKLCSFVFPSVADFESRKMRQILKRRREKKKKKTGARETAKHVDNISSLWRTNFSLGSGSPWHLFDKQLERAAFPLLVLPQQQVCGIILGPNLIVPHSKKWRLSFH